MVKHIVMYTLKEGVNKTEAVELIRSVLEPLVGKIPGLLHLEVRQAFNGLDYALYSEFENQQTLKDILFLWKQKKEVSEWGMMSYNKDGVL